MQELENTIGENIKKDIKIEKEQNNFLETTLGKTINSALDVGLRWILPDLIENQVIEIKNTLFKSGLKEGINKAIESAIDLGKSALGIITGKFDNVNQIQTAVKTGGMIDTISNVIDSAVNSAYTNGLMPKTIAYTIKSGKNILLNNVEKNIENTLTEQIRGVEKVDKYLKNWNGYYNTHNVEGMEKEYQKLKEQLKSLVPIENTLKEARKIENLHLLIKNNGQNFNVSNEELQLAQIL